MIADSRQLLKPGLREKHFVNTCGECTAVEFVPNDVGELLQTVAFRDREEIKHLIISLSQLQTN